MRALLLLNVCTCMAWAQAPGWVRLSGEVRARAESVQGLGFADAGDSYLLPRLRLTLTVQPETWLKLVVQGQDARIWGNERVRSGPPYSNTADLRAAYVEFGDADRHAVSVRAGRQELVFGEQRLVGNSNWTNTARSFDAVRATLRMGGWRVDAFASSVVPIRDGAFDRPVTGNNLHGIYATTESLVRGSAVDGYVLWRLAPGGIDFRTYGGRWAGKLPARFDFGTEMAVQTGSWGGRPLRAWAGHWQAGHTLKAAFTPRLIAEYNYATGDRGDGTRRTFDSLYPTPHAKYALTDQVGWRNMKGTRFGVEIKPRQGWTAGVNWRRWWRASARDGLYNAGGTLIVPASNVAATYIGQEISLDVLWTASKHAQFGGGVGHLLPGGFLKQASQGNALTLSYLQAVYSF